MIHICSYTKAIYLTLKVLKHLKMFVSTNPFSQQTISEIPFQSNEMLLSKQILASSTFIIWKNISFEQKIILFKKLAQSLREKKQEIAHMMTEEMGKTISESVNEIEKCAWTIDWYCEYGKKLLQDTVAIESEEEYAYIRFEPLGTVLGIMPWNFPLWQVFRYAIPTLFAGNVTLLKHAPNVGLSAQCIENLFLEAGFPAGVFQCVFASVEDCEKLIASSYIQAVTFTGSSSAGRKIASQAGQSLKKCVLELGGSDPFIVLKDADIDLTVKQAIKGRLQNNGQSCIGAKRFIIDETIYDVFLNKLKDAISQLVVGDPMLETTNIGPLARPDLKQILKKQVELSIEAGASLHYAHPFNDSDSNFFSPIILENIPLDCPARKEELFGPVFICFKVNNESEAIQIANETAFGLGSSIWTTEIPNAELLARQIQAGSVFINGITKSDARVPFGGIKDSGYGRELSGFGMHEFTNIKTYFITKS